MRKRQSEERFRGVGAGNVRTTNKRAKLVDAIFPNRWKRSVGVALLGTAFVGGGLTAFDLASVRADESTVSANVSATTPDAFEYNIEEGFVTITGLREEFREATTVSVPKQIGMGTVKKIAPNAFQKRERLETVVFADATALDEIGARAFAGCSALKSVEFGKSGVGVIGDWAFRECKALTAVELPKSVRVIGTGAFALCSSLATVSGGDGVEEIAPAAFGGCAALETVVVGPNVQKIGAGAFRGCKSLQNFELSESGNAAFKIIDGFLSPSEGGKPVDGFLTSADGKTLVACPSGRGGEVVVPEGVVEIGAGAFMMGALESVVLPQTLKKIDANAFYSCDALKSVVGAPKALETIGVEAFADCDALERFDWPENLQTIEKQAFRGCGALTTANVKSVRTIGENAFYCCAKLETLELPSATREIGAFAFAETGLKTFKAPRDLAVWNPGTTEGTPVEKFEVEEGNAAFQIVDGALLSADGKTLYYRPQNAPETSWKIPDGVRVVAEGALSGAASLTSLEIPEGVETVGAGALRGCSALKKIAIPASLRQIDETFDDCLALATFEVAEGSATFSVVDGSLLSKDGKTLYRMARNTEADAAPTEKFVVRGGYGPFATRVVPEGVERIAKGAIGSDRRVRAVEIPSTVKQIDAGAFGNCPNLTSVSIPASVEQLDERFDDCSWLATFKVDPANPVYKSVDGALLSKDGKTLYRLVVSSEDYRQNATREEGDSRKKYRYVVPEGVETIKKGAFAGAYRMSEIVFPQSLSKIESWAFNGSPLITSVVIPASVQTIEDAAFGGCDLSEVVLSSKDAKFEKTAFVAGDFETSKVTIRVADAAVEGGDEDAKEAPQTENADAASEEAQNIRQKTEAPQAENAVADVASAADAPKTLEVKIEDIEGQLARQIERRRQIERQAMSAAEVATLAPTPEAAFEYTEEPGGATITGVREAHRTSTALYIPKQIGGRPVRKIAPNAFAGLKQLETLYCDTFISEMGERAFADCVALKTVRFKEAAIGAEAFAGCVALETFDVAGVYRIAPGAFVGCRNLKTFEQSAPQNRRWKIVDALLTSADGRTLVACPGGKTGEIVVPKGVVAIADGAFAGGSVETVVLPQTLETVGEKAFAKCGALKAVVGAPKALETIGPEAFSGCVALERFDWPENLRVIEKYAFTGCKALESAAIKNVRRIGERAFSGCSKLTTLELPSGTREIGTFAFAGTALKSFKLPRELETLVAWSLDGLALESVAVEEGNEAFKIVDGAVLSADGKTLYYRPTQASGTNWKIPEGVRVVVRGALNDNASLVSVEIPEGVETIGEGAFSGCWKLQKLAIPASVKRIDDVFEGCDSLETVEVAEGNATYRSVDGALLSKDGKTLYRVARKGGATERVIPEGVERIAAGAIGDDRLTTRLTIPASVKRIDARAFGDCDSLKTIEIPASVERLDERFDGCNSIFDFRVSPENPNYKSYDGSLLSRDGKTFYRFVVADSTYRRKNESENAYGYVGYEYVIPEGVQTIKEDAFDNALHMTKVVLPQSLRTIESAAFRGATALTSVTIPAGVEKIEKDAFSTLREVVLASSSAKFEKSVFTMKPEALTIRVDDATIQREKEAADAKTAAEESAQKTFEWKIESGGSATITGVRDKTATSLNIPETIDGAPVKTIAEGACSNLPRLKTVRIGANVELIDGAFKNCVNLVKVEFAKKDDARFFVKLQLAGGAFQGCSSLRTFEAPASSNWRVEIGEKAFAGCAALETVKLSPQTTLIGPAAFLNCSSLRRVEIPENSQLARVESEAFKGCDALESFDAPASFSSLSWNTFGERDRKRPLQFNLHPDNRIFKYVDGMLITRDGKNICGYFGPRDGDLTIPEGVERLGAYMFGDAAFETVRLPKSLRQIDLQAFMNCKSLKKVEAPEDSAIEAIGDSAFRGCEALETFPWPKSLKKIGIGAFSNCALKELVGVPALETIGNNAFLDCYKMTTIELPSGLREIGSSAFADCAATSVKIPASVQTLGDAAFAMSSLAEIEVEEGSATLKVVDGAFLSKDGKSLFRLPSALKLTSYKIPNGVEIIERAAFGGNVTLETVEIPATVKTIEPNAFYRCVSLKKISIPASVEKMKSAFKLCDGLEHFEVDPKNPVYKSENGALLSADGKTFYEIVAVEREIAAEERAAAQARADLSVPGASPLTIDDLRALKPIYKNPVYRVPNGVETIDAFAFADDAGMRNAFTEIVLPESVKEIKRLAFSKCKRLEKAFIPKNVATIEEGVFKYCDALKTVEISPENANYRIENGLLLSADGKTFYEATIDRGENVLKIPNGVEKIAGFCTWSACKADPPYWEVVLPESLTEIGPNAFARWKNLTSITIPKKTSAVAANAFYECSSLAEVVLSSKDTSVDDRAFAFCAPNLTVRVLEGETEPTEQPAKPLAVVETPIPAVQTDATSDAETTSEAFKWLKVQSDEVAILGVRDKNATSVVIPETIDGVQVKSISHGAFSEMRELKKVYFSRNLETIGSRAFANCVKLEKIEFAKDENGVVASNLRRIDWMAFRDCVALKSFEAPDSLVELRMEAFCGCSSLETATLGKNLQKIEIAAFADCPALSRVDCSSCEQLTQIVSHVFRNCGALSTFDAPKSLRLIDGLAFAERSAPLAFNVDPESEFLKTIDGCLVTKPDNRLIAYFGERSGELVVPEGVEEIGEAAFVAATFETVRLPQGLRRVGKRAFAGCESLKSVEIPDDSALENIDEHAFFNCKALETFDWPKSLKRIDSSAFSACASLKSLTGATSLESIGGFAFSDCKSLATVELPSGLREINLCAFLNCNFASIKIPASVQVLREGGVACTALEKIEVEEGSEILKVVDGVLLSKDGKRLHRLPPALKLKSYKIPDGVEIIGRSALGGNVTLESVELPATVTTIENDAFYRCENLTEIAIPAKTNRIDKDAFAYCDALERFEVAPSNAVYKSENGALLSKDGKVFYRVVAVERDPNAEPFVVEPTQEGEEPRLIAAYKNSVYRVPQGVITINSDAFNDPRRARNAFTEIVLPEGLQLVGEKAFNCCERLETIRIPASVTGIGAYLNADSPESSSFPQMAFSKCRALKTFEVAPENKKYRSEDGCLLSADGKTCYGVLANVERSVWKVPEGVVTIASLAPCATKASEIVLPETLDVVLSITFQDCENLTSITLPKNVRFIQPEAFYNCPKLAEVVLKSSDTVYSANSFKNVAPNLTIRLDESDEPTKDAVETTPKTSRNDASEATQTQVATLVQPQVSEVAPTQAPAVKAVRNRENAAFKWREENDGATITVVKNETATSIVIPETLGGLPVKAVGTLAFARMSELKTVQFPKSLETIGSRAFGGCVKLENIEFAKDEKGAVASRLQAIDDYAFWKCAALKSFAAPDSLVKLGGWAFSDCPALETTRLGKNLEGVSTAAFANCGALKHVDVSACEKLTTIANDAFKNCGALSSFDAPKSLRHVDATAFAGRTTPLAFSVDSESKFLKLVDGCLVTKTDNELTDNWLVAYFGERSGELVVPEGVENVYVSAFAETDFETVRLPKSLRLVNNEAFKNCKSLKRVVIPEDSELQTIGVGAFAGCKALETFDWPKSLKKIALGAFSDCESLKSFAGATSVEQIYDFAFANCRSLATVELPSVLRQVGVSAFSGAGFEKLKIPASLQVVGESAFASLSPREKIEVEEGSETFKVVDGALLSKNGKTLYRLPLYLNATTYKVPDGVETIERDALRGNESLESVELPATLRTIKNNAFYGCLSLKEIAIPAKTARIDGDAFAGCDALERFEVDPSNVVYKSENGALLSADGKTFYKIVAVERDPNAKARLKTVELKGRVLSLEALPNGEYRLLREREPSRVSVCEKTYKNSVYRVPNGVETLADGAFFDERRARNAFTEIVLPESLAVIGENAFNSCERLETLRIPANVAQLGASPTLPSPTVFVDCDALKTFEIASENKAFRSDDGMLLSSDGASIYDVVADRGRSVLKIPEGVVHFPGRGRHLGDAAKVVFPDSANSIPATVFQGYPNLTSVTVSKNMREIGAHSFRKCPRLAEVVLRSNATIVNENAFSFCAPNLTIRVEEEEAQATQAASSQETAETKRADIFARAKADGGNAIIKSVYDKNATTLEIPEKLDGLAVVTIGADAFAEMRELRTVRLPSSLQTISRGAFRNCAKLENIEFAKDKDGNVASSLQFIHDRAFAGCSSLKSFEVPDSVVRIKPSAFEGCSLLATVALGKGALSVDERAFANCASLRRLDLSRVEKLRTFDKTALVGTPDDLEIVFPDDSSFLTADGFLLTNDGKTINAYLGKRSGEIAIPEGVESIDQSFFGMAAGIESVRLPKSLRAIGSRAFYRCESLKSVIIPEDSKLEMIGDLAFAECYALERFDWPKSLQTIGVSAFCYCRSLKSFKGATSVQTIGASAFCDCESLTEIELPKGVREIGPSAFAECGFTSIKIPASVQVMGDAALAVTPLKTIEVEPGNPAVKVVDGALFSKDGKSLFRLPPALKLKSYKIPDGVEIVERAALGGNETLESVEIPASVKTIERNAFYRNSSLTEIYIPSGVMSLDDAFPLCDALERFEVDPNNPVYKSENGALLSKDGTTFYRVVAVERDPNAAPIVLEGNESLSQKTKRDETSRSIPAYKNSVYVVPDGVVKLAEDAFNDVRRTRNAFTEIVLPQSLKEIRANAFQYCSRLETLRIPANVETIVYHNAFIGCDALKTFEIAPENSDYRVEDGLLLSADGKMFYCVVVDKDRRVLKLPEGVKQTAENLIAAKKFEELVLPESLITIGNRSFGACENLTSVTIPKNVRFIGFLAFAHSPKLAEVALKSSKTKYEANSFEETAPNLTIRVDESAPTAVEKTQTPTTQEDTSFEESALTPKEAAKIFNLEFQGDEATIVRVLNQDASSVDVPRKIGEHTVTRIANNAFGYMHYLVEARLPSTIREIGDYAFTNCHNLEQIVIPSGTESVGLGAFSNCRSLRAIAVSLENKTYKVVRGSMLSADGKTLYAYPTGRVVDKVYEIPDGVETIAPLAFDHNLHVKEVKFPWTLKCIEKQAFEFCEALEAIHFFPVVNRLETIGDSAFGHCKALKSINLPDGIRRIGTGAFNETGLETVEFYPVDPEVKPGVTIETRAFAAPNLAAFEIPETLLKLDLQSVSSSRKIALKLPPNLKTSIDWASQITCAGIASFDVDSNCDVYRVVYGVLLSKDGKTLYRYPNGRVESEYVVPEGVERIASGAFEGASFRTIRLPKTLKTLENGALARNVELTTVEIPEGVESCGEGLFRGCAKLTAVKFPATLRYIDFAAAFYDCPALTTVELAPGAKLAKSVDGALLSPDGSKLYFYPPLGGATSFNIPESVTSIVDGAFRGNATLKTVRFSKNVVSVGVGAFEKCKSLQTLTLNDGLSDLGANAFAGCSALTAVKIPDSVHKLGGSAFGNCSRLTTVKIPAKASQVEGAFWGCVSLRAIEVDSANPEYKSVDGVLLSKDGKTLYEYPEGKDVEEYRVPDGVVEIVSHAFRAGATTQPKKIVLPSSVQTVKPFAFTGRKNFEVVAPETTKFGDFQSGEKYKITVRK